MPAYDRALVDGATLTREQIAALSERLLTWPVARVLQIPTMVPGRADVICAGALIVRRIAERLAVPLAVSEADILDGLVAGLLA